MSNIINLLVQFQSIPIEDAECRMCDSKIKAGKAYGLFWARREDPLDNLTAQKTGDCFHKKCLKAYFQESKRCLKCEFPLSNIDNLQSIIDAADRSTPGEKYIDVFTDLVEKRDWNALKELSYLDVQLDSLEKSLRKAIKTNDIELIEALCSCSGCFLAEQNLLWAECLTDAVGQCSEEFVAAILRANESLPEAKKALSDSDLCDGFEAAPATQQRALLDILLNEIKNPSDVLLKAMFLQCYDNAHHLGMLRILEKGRELFLEDRSDVVLSYSISQDGIERVNQLELLRALLNNGPIEPAKLNTAKLLAKDDLKVLEILNQGRIADRADDSGEGSNSRGLSEDNYLL